MFWLEKFVGKINRIVGGHLWLVGWELIIGLWYIPLEAHGYMKR
jgi:hypothetical protein